MLETLKESVWAANMELFEKKLIVYTWGNVSGIDRESGIVAIKPSGVSYEALRPEDIVLVSLHDGSVVEGNLRPSSDTPTHLAIYRHFPEVGGVVHTHSTYATAWSQAGLPIPNIGTTHADTFYCDIPCTDEMSHEQIATAYEAATGDVIAEAFKGMNPMHTPAVLVKHHGPFTWGKSAANAVYNAVVLEEVARMASITVALNPKVEMNQDLVEKHYERKHGANAYYGQKK
jgi:L-ribulose-5-phosphate 4-epimerase